MNDIKDLIKDLCGFDLTTQPANNVGDPLAKKTTTTIQEDIDNLFYENKSNNELLIKSEEQMKELDKTLEFFKDEECFNELTNIIKNVL